MANLTDSSVEILRSFFESGLTNKDRVTKRVKMTLNAQGTLAAGAQIPAIAFGLAHITRSESFVKDDNSLIYPTTPSADGLFLLIGAPATGVPTATTGVLIGVVTGPPYQAY